MMMTALWVAPAAILMSATLTVLARRLAPVLGAVDRPGPLSVHQTPTARTGGLAVAGTVLVIGALGLARSESILWTSWSAVAGGGVIVVVLGLVDDIRGINPWTKLAIELAVAFPVVWFGWNLSITGLMVPDTLISMFWIAFLMNAQNLIDGLDGLATGTAAVTLASLALWLYGADSAGGLLAISCAGACVGFLWYNFPPSRGIFLGDSGSLFLGFLMGVLSIQAVQARTIDGSGIWRALLPLSALALPVAEALFVILRRLLRGVSPFHGDRLHLYDEVHRRLGSTRKTVLAYYALAIVCCLTGWFFS